MNRRIEPELMDHPNADPEQLGYSLQDLLQVNRWLGGRRSALDLILRLAGKLPPQEVTVLDVGTGGADVPLALVSEGRRRGLDLRVTATDLHPLTVGWARAATAAEATIEVIEADALRLPFEDDNFDLAMCCTTLHHFSRDDAIQALRELSRVARSGVVVTDLARSRLALFGARVLAATVWRGHPITRHDGPASVCAAFTVRELESLAAEAGIGSFQVLRQPIFRLALIIDRTGSRTPARGG